MNREQVVPSQIAQDWHHSKCFACGPDNKHGLHGDFSFDEKTGEVNFEYIADDYCIGAPGYLHGGVLAAIMDEAQGVLCHHIGHFVMTEKLQMTYSKATELNQPFRVRAWATAVRRRRLYTRATITGQDGLERVRSKASWYLLPERLCFKMMGVGRESEVDKFRTLMDINRKRAKEIRQRIKKNARQSRNES